MDFSPLPTRILALATLLLGALLPARAAAQSPHDSPFRLRAGALVLDLETELKVDGRGLKGSRIELEDDLDLATTPAMPYGELMVGSIYRIYLTWLSSTRVSDDIVTEPIRYNNHILADRGDRVEGRSELLNADIMFGTRLWGDQGFRLDVIFGGKYIHLKNRIVNREEPLGAAVTTRSSTDTVDTAGLYAGLDGHLTLGPRLTLFARLLLSSYTANLFDVERFSYFDFSLGITWGLFAGINLAVDWRTYSLALAHENSGGRSVYDVFGTGVGVAALIAF